jgi:molecular chaperone GrpE
MVMSSKKTSNRAEEAAPEVASSADADTATDRSAKKSAGRGVGASGGRAGRKKASESEAVADLAEEVAHWKAYAMRAQAEFENTKKRLQASQLQALERAGERVVSGLIPVMDDLEYGLAHAQETKNEMAEGLEAIYAKLRGILEAEGVSLLDPTGKPFDHNTAQAVQVMPAADTPENTVIQTLQKGYVMGSRVIRPAMVVVSAADSS